MNNASIELLVEGCWVRDFDAMPEHENRFESLEQAQLAIDRLRELPEYTMCQLRAVPR